MATPTILWRDYFTSVGDVWLLWAVCLVAMVFLVRRAYRGRNWAGAAAFAADERGASYALSYVLTFPFYLILMCLIIQATLILMVKMGTVYAAHAAARTAIVWRPSLPERTTDETDQVRYDYTIKKAQRAAALGMTPFASGTREHRDGMWKLGRIPAKGVLIDAPLYLRMYQRNARHNTGQSDADQYMLQRLGPNELAKTLYVINKFLFASAATSVEFEQEKLVPWNEDFQVTVTYTMPMQIPAVGRLFGNRYAAFYARDISTSVTLPSEAPETESSRLNIPYDPAKLLILR